MHRSFIAATALGLALVAPLSPAQADGAPALAVQELVAKGLANPGPYLMALNRRGPMLATCFGSREAMEASEPFEAFLEVGKDGQPQLVNLQALRTEAEAELDVCLLTQLNKVRFPEAKKVVELKVRLGPAPEEAPAEDPG